MTDTPQANPQGLMAIGAVAAHNIAAFLNLDVSHVGTIEQAIKDEINALSSHFTLAIADVNTQYEVELAKLKKDNNDFVVATHEKEKAAIAAFKAKVDEIKSTFRFASANVGPIVATLVAVFSIGGLVGYYVAL